MNFTPFATYATWFAVDDHSCLPLKSIVTEVDSGTVFVVMFCSDIIITYSELKKFSPIAITGGESLRTSSQFKDFLVNQSYDIVQPDVANVGGITEFKRIINMASTMGIQTIPHVWGTPVMIAASLHVASTIPNSPRMDNPQPFLQEPGMEYDRTNNPLRENISSETEPFKFENGYLNVPGKPGLGIEISEENVEQMCIEKLESKI